MKPSYKDIESKLVETERKLLEAESKLVEEMLSNYKEQQAVERGFRFLKDPFFMTSSMFLKNQNRIMALGMDFSAL